MLQSETVHGLFSRVGFLSKQSDVTRERVFLLLLCLLVFLPGLGLRDPWPADEPRFALVAKQMVESGHWFFPTRGNEFYADKPPVFMWLIAVFYALIGNMKLAFLLPSTLAAIGVIFLVYDLGSRLWSRKEGLAAATSLLVLVQFVVQAKSAQIDMVLTFWTTLALYGMVRHLIISSAPIWFLTGCFSMGLGIITKGVGFLPLLLIIPFFLAKLKGWLPLNQKVRWWWPLLSLVFLLIGIAVWLGPMLFLVESSGDPALLAYKNDILYKQTADRYLRSWHHIKPFWYFVLGVMPWAWLPFSLLIVNYLKSWWKKIKVGDNRFLTLILWGLSALLFFSLTKGKRGVYILPLLPAFALLVGAVQEEVFSSKRVQVYFRCLGVLFGALFVAAGIGLLIRPAMFFDGTGFSIPIGFLIGFILFGFLIGVVSIIRIGKFKGNHSLFLVMVMIWLFLSVVIWPGINPLQSPRLMMHEIRQVIGPKTILGMVSWKEQLLLQAEGPTKTFGFKKDHDLQMEEAISWMKEAEQNHWLLINENKGLEPFDAKDASYSKRIHGRNWYLFEKAPE